MTTPRALRLDPSDNVIIAIDDIPAGAEPAPGVNARERVPKGHKMAVVPDRDGRAGAQIRPDHRLCFARRSRPANGCTSTIARCTSSRATMLSARTRGRENIAAASEQPTFEGFRRANGKVGTRNYLGDPDLGELLGDGRAVHRARRSSAPDMLDDYPNVDGVVALVHGTGCGIAAQGRGLRRADAHRNGATPATPTSARRLMVGLGCEVFQIGRMKEDYGIAESDTFRTMTIQATGGTRKTVEAGVERIRAMLPALNDGERETGAGERADAGAAMRRLGRLFGHHRQSGARRRRRHPGAPRRHRDPLRDAGDLRRRASADPPRRDAARSARSSSSASTGGRTTPPATAAR